MQTSTEQQDTEIEYNEKEQGDRNRNPSRTFALDKMFATMKTYLPNKPASIRLQNLDSLMRVEDASRRRRITDVFYAGPGLSENS